jgi:hypothetical protein
MMQATNRRRNVRANLHTGARLSGTDKWGKPFDVWGESTDVSRKGLGLSLDWVIVAPGADISVELPGRLRANAMVQWVRFDAASKRVRMGVRLVNPRTSLRFRIAAGILLVTSLLTQLSVAKSRWGFLQPAPAPRCNVGAHTMKSLIDVALAQPNMITEPEKTFVRTQHDHMSCEDYTRLFERSNYYKSPGKRDAMTKWHWQVFHSHEEGSQGAASRAAEAAGDGQ